jgi:hypothetical protein
MIWPDGSLKFLVSIRVFFDEKTLRYFWYVFRPELPMSILGAASLVRLRKSRAAVVGRRGWFLPLARGIFVSNFSCACACVARAGLGNVLVFQSEAAYMAIRVTL